MIRAIRRIWHAAPVATVILAISLAIGLFFAVRMISFAIYWSDPAHRNQVIEGWMTPGYVAHSWQVPREVVTDALGVARQPGGPQSLQRLAETDGVPVEVLIERARNAIAAFTDANPPGRKP